MKTNLPTAIVPNSPGSSENGQLSTLPNIQSQVKTRNARNNANNNSPTKENLSNNRKTSLQRPQSIDIEDEFNDKIRSARLAALQNNSEDMNLTNLKDSNFNTKTNESMKSKMAPLFSPSRKMLLDSNGKQPQIPKSQSPSPSKIPIANDYFDIATSKNHKRSNVSPPRKLTPSSQSTMTSENNSSHDATMHTSESQISHQSRRNASDSPLTSNGHSDKEKINDLLSETTTKLRGQMNGTTTDENCLIKGAVLTNTEINGSKIPLPKNLNNRSRSASQSPSKHEIMNSASPEIVESSVRGRSETKTRSTPHIMSSNSRESPTTPGLPTHGWCLQTERQEQRSAERIRNHQSEAPAYNGKH